MGRLQPAPRVRRIRHVATRVAEEWLLNPQGGTEPGLQAVWIFLFEREGVGIYACVVLRQWLSVRYGASFGR